MSTAIIDTCHADKDGDCSWRKCPQMRDNEPFATGRHCPLDACVVRHVVGDTCAGCNGTGLVPFGLPSNGPDPCPDCVDSGSQGTDQ